MEQSLADAIKVDEGRVAAYAVADTTTSPSAFLHPGPVQRALFLRECFHHRAVGAAHPEVLDLLHNLIVQPRAGPARSTGACWRRPREWDSAPAWPSGTRSPGATAKRESPPSVACPCVATVVACSRGAVRVTGPPTLCGCSRQDGGPTDEGWLAATRSRAGPLRRQCRPSGAASPSHPCAGALAAPS